MTLFELHMNVAFPRDLLHLHKVCQGWNNYDLTFHCYFHLFAIVVGKKLRENSTIISIFINVSCPRWKANIFLKKTLNLFSYVHCFIWVQPSVQFVVDFLISIIESALHECRFPRIRNANFCFQRQMKNFVQNVFPDLHRDLLNHQTVNTN